MSEIEITDPSKRTSVFEKIKDGKYLHKTELHSPLQKMARLRSYYAHYRFPLEIKKDLHLISGFRHSRSLLGDEDLKEVYNKARELIDLVQEKVDKEWSKNRSLLKEEKNDD